MLVGFPKFDRWPTLTLLATVASRFVSECMMYDTMRVLHVLSGAVIENIMLYLLMWKFLLFMKVKRAPWIFVKELWY